MANAPKAKIIPVKVISYQAPPPAADRPAVGIPTNAPHPDSHSYHGTVGQPHPGNPMPKGGGPGTVNQGAPITSTSPQETA